MPTPLKRILAPLSSLKLTVVLLILSMVLVFAGTLAQRDAGIWQVQHQYFHSVLCWIPLHNLFFGHFQVGGKPLVVPMLGGYSLGLLLLINLLAAHILRFKFRPRDLWLVPALALVFLVGRIGQNLDVYQLGAFMLIAAAPFFALLAVFHTKRTGVILIHLGLILLIAGEAITSIAAVESQMTIAEGEGKNWSQDIRKAELAIVDTSPVDHDNVVSIPAQRLADAGAAAKANKPKQATISDPKLPFDVTVDAYYPNSDLLGPFQMRTATGVLKADTGESQSMGAVEQPQHNGVDAGGAIDAPAGYVTLSTHKGQRLGRYVVGVFLNRPQTIEVDGKTYEIALRFPRVYKPFTLYLHKFSFDRYPGTNIPKNYSSLVRLVDPTRHEDREVRIWMNHPLRYAGETFFQADFDHQTEKSTVLQVVTNPGWLMPYVACAVGSAGLVTHFLIVLINFITKQAKMNAAQSGGRLPPQSPQRKPQPKKNSPARGGAGILPQPALSVDKRTGAVGAGVLLPLGLIVFCVIYLIGHAMPPRQSATGMDLQTFAALPVQKDGRTQPYDSLFRNALKIVSGKQSFKEDDKKVTAVEWGLDTMTDPDAGKHKVIRIDNKEIAGLLTTDFAEKMFSLNDVLAHWDQLGPQLRQLPEEMPKDATLYQRKLDELRNQLRTYFSIAGVENVGGAPLFKVDGAELRQMLGVPADRVRVSLNEILEKRDAVIATRKEAEGVPESSRTALQASVVKLVDAAETFSMLLPREGVLVVPPLDATGANATNEKWMSVDEAMAQDKATGTPSLGARSVLFIQEAFARNRVADFNEAVNGYHARLAQALPAVTAKADFEAKFNHFDPFMNCVVFYIMAFVLVALSWLGFGGEWTAALYRSAFVIMVLALLVHTWGLGARVYISGRPPVTNLASSAIFIAWGAVIGAILLEVFWKNGIGMLSASLAGFLSLLIADGLAADGDTLKVLQAVLDTNWWLATHVVAVTLGYASTFLAGFLGIVYVAWSLTGNMNKDDSKTLSRMTYGVVCFAMLFSFVGTVLGGIWADQSWGRFWGWDPKENGAVLIVLSNALLLHLRWGGMIKARGIANVAILGNVVTAWSWFGTNMLGIGLHSYGFMEKAFPYLIMFVVSQVALAVVGLFTPEPLEA